MSPLLQFLLPWHLESERVAQKSRAEDNRVRTIESSHDIEIVARRAESVARAYLSASEVIPLL
jgi:hypothetical protein